MPVDAFRPHVYQYKGVEAARHLFDVAAVLDSLVIGEPQILGQIVRGDSVEGGEGASGPDGTVPGFVRHRLQYRPKLMAI